MAAPRRRADLARCRQGDGPRNPAPCLAVTVLQAACQRAALSSARQSNGSPREISGPWGPCRGQAPLRSNAGAISAAPLGGHADGRAGGRAGRGGGGRRHARARHRLYRPVTRRRWRRPCPCRPPSASGGRQYPRLRCRRGGPPPAPRTGRLNAYFAVVTRELLQRECLITTPHLSCPRAATGQSTGGRFVRPRRTRSPPLDQSQWDSSQTLA